MKKLLIILLTLTCIACGSKSENPPAEDESRGVYPQENVDDQTVDAVSPRTSQDTVKADSASNKDLQK